MGAVLRITAVTYLPQPSPRATGSPLLEQVWLRFVSTVSVAVVIITALAITALAVGVTFLFFTDSSSYLQRLEANVMRTDSVVT